MGYDPLRRVAGLAAPVLLAGCGGSPVTPQSAGLGIQQPLWACIAAERAADRALALHPLLARARPCLRYGPYTADRI